MQQPDQHKKGKRGSNWIGLVIFLLIIAGQPILNIVSNIVARISNNTVTMPTNILPLVIGGFVLVATLIALVQGARNLSERGTSQQFPTNPTGRTPEGGWKPRSDTFKAPSAYTPPRPPESPYTSPSGLPPSLQQRSVKRDDISPQKLPGAPRFEPIVDARVVTFGILGLVFLGIVFGAAFLLWIIPMP